MATTNIDPRTELVTTEEFTAARERLRDVVLHTPLVRLTSVSESVAYLKAESLQPIGSFKLRGASNAVAQLTEAQRRRGVITYSSGNHGQGVAYAARAFGVRAIIVMPANAPEIKRRATAALGAEIVTVGPASSERRERAEALAAEHGYAIIPPYDDPAIIAGQGTCGLEILEDCPEVDLVLAPVGGGGLLSGVAAAIRRQRSETSARKPPSPVRSWSRSTPRPACAGARSLSTLRRTPAAPLPTACAPRVWAP